MGRDRKDQISFNYSPFRSLKGLSVSGEQPPRPVAPPAPPVPPVEADDPDLFTREMAWQNVRPLGAGSSRERVHPPAAVPPAEDEAAAEFLAAVGRVDKVFHDELPSGDEPTRARPRRMKQLERGELVPAGELDLHGLTRDEALPRTRAFLGHAARQRWPVVVIVTGKGLHSAEGPVLRRAVERLLDESRDLVLEWGEAPRRLGGAGALAVFLRKVKSEK